MKESVIQVYNLRKKYLLLSNEKFIILISEFLLS